MASKNKNKKPSLVALSAGGTGGHIIPARAIERVLIEMGHKAIFVTDHRGVQWFPENDNLDIRVVSASAIHAGLLGKAKSAIKIGLGTLKSLKIFILNRPKLVIGFGGYPSFPALLAAHILKIPIILHEQNAVFGRANRVVAPWTEKIALSFEKTINIPTAVKDKCVVTGNPPQQKVIDVADTPYPDRVQNMPFRLLVLGGSQGAKIFGEVIHRAVKLLPDDLKEYLVITQQCLKQDVADVASAYEQMNVNARVEPFIRDYIDQLTHTHLIISRAGAASVSLYANMGRPAIYVPLAISLDGDQAHNAKNMTDFDAGWILEEKALSPEVLASKLEQFMRTPSLLKKTAKQAKTLNRLDAKEKLIEIVTPYL